ncbi:MAG: DUF6814 family protein [Flavisolibacter sp.]
MYKIKRLLGLVWMILGPLAITGLVVSAIRHIASGGTGDIHKPLPWIIIIGIFLPVAAGLVVFGWYAWKGNYDDNP